MTDTSWRNRKTLILSRIPPSGGGIHLNDLPDFPGPPQAVRCRDRGLSLRECDVNAKNGMRPVHPGEMPELWPEVGDGVKG